MDEVGRLHRPTEVERVRSDASVTVYTRVFSLPPLALDLDLHRPWRPEDLLPKRCMVMSLPADMNDMR